MMQLTLNGKSIQLREDNLRALLEANGIEPERRGIAVAVNGQVVPRNVWGEREVHDGDVVEVIAAMQGG